MLKTQKKANKSRKPIKLGFLKVFGKNAENKDESVADYQFRVNQK
jgi:hypothetical protein